MIRPGDWVVMLKSLPPSVARLPAQSQRVFASCVGRTHRVADIDEYGHLVLDVITGADQRFGGYVNDIRVEPEYVLAIDLPSGMRGLPCKDGSIVEVLSKLGNALGPNPFQLVDNWDADLFAVGIASPQDPNIVVYISTRRHPPSTYYYECEFDNPDACNDEFPYVVAEERDNVSFAELLEAVRRHFARERRTS